MNHIERLTRYTANFVDELACSGLRHVVISPGSRSTPLAVLFREHEKIKDWIVIDERSAAYFALGIARETNEPVAIVCTSGTATANYYPAIIEAFQARVPLIVLTADRPHELRGTGANQTIDQLNMFGNFVKDFQEMALPESTPAMLKYVRNRAARAIRKATVGRPGPVHFNFPFREPLLPDLSLPNLWGESHSSSYNVTYTGEKRLTEKSLSQLANKLKGKKKGLLVCGPQVNHSLGEAICKLSEKLQAPILADPLSQLRSGDHSKAQIVTMYDAILKSKQLREELKPDYIIRFGAMPISKSYLFFVEDHEDILQIVVEDYDEIREPTNHHSEYIYANGKAFCHDLLSHVNVVDDRTWLEHWMTMEKIVIEEIEHLPSTVLTEGETVHDLLHVIPNQSTIFVANSMPVRDLDTFFTATDKDIYVHANRGVSGIDGTVSTALGVAATTERPVTLIIGDLSFYHDLNSLLIAKHYDINLTIVLINNNGGGIFSFLPQAKEEKHFEALFGTPLDIDFKHAIKMYGGNYRLVKNREDYLESLNQAYEQQGLQIIEVQTDRTDNVAWHRMLFKNIEKRLTS